MIVLGYKGSSHFAAILILGILIGSLSPCFAMSHSTDQSQLLKKAQKLINQRLDDWRVSSSDIRDLACYLMLKNLEAAGDKNYSGVKGQERLIAEIYALRVCINEASKANVNIEVSETAVACIILMEE